ncbi:nuclear cap-binding protein subunit 1-like, partial [Morus notabilis]|uniref:nuclear cap-binding protein subunit 1-like n=1 Tax=Morus notabilis TaxID=981085 RepID=UPI000CED3152
DFLEDLWDRIQVLSTNGWKLDSVPRPHLSFEAQLVAGKSHEFGSINCPDQPGLPSTTSSASYGKQKHDAELRYPQRIRRLNIFPPSKSEDIQPIDRFVMEEYLLDVLYFFNGWFVTPSTH